MSHVEAEIRSQPDCWRQAAGMAVDGVPGLPAAGEQVAVIGCGTSLFMAHAYAALRESSGHGLTDAFPASEMPDGRRYDRVVAISRSGATTEVLDALGRLPRNAPTTAIVADAGTPVAAAARDVVALPFADERSIVQTRFATSALFLLRTHLAWLSSGRIHAALEEMGRVIDDGRRAVGDDLPDGASDAQQFTFLGRGWVSGLASEAALKLREAAQAWTEAYPAMEYRHGPISVTGPRTLVWMLDAGAASLAAEIASTGATAILAELDPMAELVRAQRLAVALAAARGLDPDRPRHLERAVVLSPDDER